MVHGVGILGNAKSTDGNGKQTREYILWHGMLQRCYSDKYHETHQTYKDCTVCERWLVFANFLEDLPLIEGYEFWRDNPKQGIALDKDSKIEGNKIYSIDTCKFVSKSNNTKERVKRCGLPNCDGKTIRKVMAISLTENKVIIFQSMTQAKKLGFTQQNISACCNGKHKSHKGYKWKFVD